MRRHDREVSDFRELADILRRADTIRLGLQAEPYPYVVPLSFGFEASIDKLSGNNISLYFHGAREGFKHDLLARNPQVCVEADIFHRYAAVPGSVTAEYESFIGFGRAARVSGKEAIHGMDLLLAHCGFEGFTYDRAALDVTWIYKIELDSFTGKHNLRRGLD